MITAENITRHELIGLETTILESNNSQVVGLHGKIIDETKSMFTIKTSTGIKHMSKSRFHVEIQSEWSIFYCRWKINCKKNHMKEWE